MKKIYSIISILLLTILLAACGTPASNEKADQPTPPTETNNTEESGSAEEGGSDKETEAEKSTNPDEELTGVTTNSETQNYSITVKDGFELTSEEPNRDMLFNKANDLQTMRIETFSPNEVTMEEVTENIVNTLEASNESETVIELSDPNQIPQSELIKDVKAYQIDTPDGKITGYSIAQDGLIVKVTVFDTKESPALETFKDMAETIKIK